MILFASGRCDIPAYYSEWFYHRLQEGFVDVRNPFNAHQISRIYLNEQNVDAIVFCTKNPIPMLDRLNEITFPYLFHITFTPYKEDIEQVGNKKEILNAVIKMADTLGKKRVVVRYDPIFLSEIYTLEYHEAAFQKLCKSIQGHIETIVISFVDMYKNTKANMQKMRMKEMQEHDMREIGRIFGNIAKQYQIQVQTCAEAIDLSAYGITSGACFDRKQMENIVGHSLAHIKSDGVRATCACMATVDIGDYNCCANGCLYCYANYDAKQIDERMKLHDPHSSVLIGHVEKQDTIIERKETSVKQESLSI